MHLNMPNVFLKADYTFTPMLSNCWGLTSFKINSCGKKINSSHICMPLFKAYKSQYAAVQVHYFLLRVSEMLMQMSFSTWGSMSRANSLFVCWLVLDKDKLSCAACILEQLKPKNLSRNRETEAHLNQQRKPAAEVPESVWTPPVESLGHGHSCCTFPIFPSYMPDQEWCSTLQE